MDAELLRAMRAKARRSGRRTVVWKALEAASLVAALAAPLAVSAADAPRRPNIVVILADDMGYADMGSFGGEIKTPNLDALAALAADGVRFTNFYTHASCSPTRSMLLTGVDTHLNGLGNMDEWTAPNQVGVPGYEGYLNNRVATLPQLLKGAGYHTYMVGKWHMGKAPDQIPAARGFERDFSLLDGAGSYWDMTNFTAASPRSVFTEDGRYLTRLPADYYATKTYTDKLIGFIDDNKADGKPFFAYVSHQAPHDPYHLPRAGTRCARSGSSGKSRWASRPRARSFPSACGSSPTRSFSRRPAAPCSARRWSSMQAWWKTSTTTSGG